MVEDQAKTRSFAFDEMTLHPGDDVHLWIVFEQEEEREEFIIQCVFTSIAGSSLGAGDGTGGAGGSVGGGGGGGGGATRARGAVSNADAYLPVEQHRRTPEIVDEDPEPVVLALARDWVRFDAVKVNKANIKKRRTMLASATWGVVHLFKTHDLLHGAIVADSTAVHKVGLVAFGASLDSV